MTDGAPSQDQSNARVDLTRSNETARAPKQQNDRDESVGSTTKQVDPKVDQARRDLEQGKGDTSRAEATDATYERQK